MNIKNKKKTEEQKKRWFEAVSKNDIKTIKKMLKEGWDINITTVLGVWTALHYACYYGHFDIAKLLIDNGADVILRDDNGYAPLDDLKGRYSKQYEKLIEWIAEEYPEKALEIIASENVRSRGVGL